MSYVNKEVLFSTMKKMESSVIYSHISHANINKSLKNTNQVCFGACPSYLSKFIWKVSICRDVRYLKEYDHAKKSHNQGSFHGR